jgi:hypothetical protein
MSRNGGISPRIRRAWAYGVLVFFLVLCAGIAVSQWYAEHVNVPKFRHQLEK